MTPIRDVVIIGSGPAGLTAAIYTARANLAPVVLEGEPSSTSDQPGGQLMLTTEVDLTQRRASKIMQDRAKNNPKIRFAWNSQVTEVFGQQSVEGVQLTDTVTGATSRLDVTGLFVAIGHRPNTDLFRGQLDLKDNGYLITQPGSARTNIDGVFACGDVQDDTYRQAITAAGSGCMAAIDAERWLEAQH